MAYGQKMGAMWVRLCVVVLLSTGFVIGTGSSSLRAQTLLVPMDREQQNHLRAYGLAYWSLEHGHKGEWLLN